MLRAVDIKRLLIFLIFTFLMSVSSYAQSQGFVKSIHVEGNRKIEKEAILGKILSKENANLSNQIVKEDILRLHKMGYFDSVQVHLESGKLIYKVKERPTIRQIVFHGNSEVSTDDLKGVLKIKNFNFYDENKVLASVAELQKYYEDKGFYLAKVQYDIRESKGKDTVDLLFRIKEYDKVKVKQVTFLGNTAFSDDKLGRILRHTREDGFFSWLTGGGNFKELDFKTDMQILQYWYLNEGYVRFRHEPPIVNVSEDKKWVYITIRVHEGEKYDVSNISFDGDLLYPIEDLNRDLNLLPGEHFAIMKRNQDVLQLTEKYQDLGYANVNVIPNMEIDDEARTVSITYEFDKGNLVRFGRITIKGNDKTRDKVVRRELRIHEGELYTGSGMRESKANVERLGFFEGGSVEFITSAPPGNPDVMDVEISLKERPTGQFQLGAGYGSASKFFFTTQVAETNFRGMGQDLRFSGQWSSNTRYLTVSFTDPYAFDTNWSLGGEFFSQEQPVPGVFAKKSLGMGIRVGHPLDEEKYTRLFLGYRLERIRLKDVEDPQILADLGREEGTKSAITVSVVHDKRNNRLEPTGGHYASIREEFAGIGGNRDFLKSVAEGRIYRNLFWDIILRSKVEVGNIKALDDEKVQRDERFYLGGPNNLKGYDGLSVGPTKLGKSRDGERDILFNAGGLNEAFFILELEKTIIPEVGIKLVAFYDVGDSFNEWSNARWKHSYGWGIRWFSPLGPLRFEWGYPLGGGSENDNREGVFNFFIGPPF